MVSTEQAATFTVGKQKMTTEPDGQGGVHQVWKVPFTTGSGAEGHVTVPDNQYTMSHVAELIKHKVAHVEAVARLGQGEKK